MIIISKDNTSKERVCHSQSFNNNRPKIAKHAKKRKTSISGVNLKLSQKGQLPANIRESLVDHRSQKDKKQTERNFPFFKLLRCNILISNLYNLLLLLLAALK